VVQILFEQFEEATARATQDWKKKGRILKIILYGSYARGRLGRRAAHRQGLSI
jgi:predicted nucleotidyltransferase